MQQFTFSNAKTQVVIVADTFGDAVEKLPEDFLDNRHPTIKVKWSPVTPEHVQRLVDRINALEQQIHGLLQINTR